VESGGPKEPCIGRGLFSRWGKGQFCQPIVKCRKYQDSGVKQNYLEGGSSDAALRCQYGSNLFLLLLLLLLLLFVLYFLRCFLTFISVTFVTETYCHFTIVVS